jgi:hypothetical protein
MRTPVDPVDRLEMRRTTVRPRTRPESLFLLLVLVALMAGVAKAARVNVPIGVGITAYVNEKPADVIAEYDWVVSHKRTEIRLYIRKLRVKTGQVSSSAVDSAVNPYPVAFHLAGDEAALQTLVGAPVGSMVTIDGYIASSALVDAVNCAIALERPLLIKGEPGTGKTVLAQHVAEGLGHAAIEPGTSSRPARPRTASTSTTPCSASTTAASASGDVSDIRALHQARPARRAFRARSGTCS